MLYQIVLEQSALDDIEQAARWIARQAKTDPMGKTSSWVGALQDAIGTLDHLPFRCSLVPESKTLIEEYRQLLFQKHRIIYTVRSNEVRILHVRHQRQGPLTLDDF